MAVFGKGRYGVMVIWQSYKADTYWFEIIGSRDRKYSYFYKNGKYRKLEKLEKPARPRVDSRRRSC